MVDKKLVESSEIQVTLYGYLRAIFIGLIIVLILFALSVLSATTLPNILTSKFSHLALIVLSALILGILCKDLKTSIVSGFIAGVSYFLLYFGSSAVSGFLGIKYISSYSPTITDYLSIGLVFAFIALIGALARRMKEQILKE
ncbi:MAG TPA: hypothetical protein VNF06_03560 [Candidatus Aquilonibacter sp.]|nr:hypothetical protein [Candidatus Aquilonibacter sp.]